MSYDLVKAGIAARLNALGYVESSQAIDFKDAPANEYSYRYILKCVTGENKENTIIDRFDDEQDWNIQVAFSRSENNDIVQYDALHRAKDLIIKDLDKPANWVSFVKMLKYEKWEVIETPNYFVISIRLKILDQYIHG